MQDIKIIRETPELIIKDLEKRKETKKIELVEKIIVEDKKWREIKYEEDSLRSERNKLSKEINTLKKQGKDIKKILEEVKKIPLKIKELEQKRKKIEEKIDVWLKDIPNLMHESVPYGKDDSENVEIRKWGTPKKFDFELMPHSEIAEKLNVADFERSAKISGSGFYILKGKLALLNQALIRFAIDTLVRKKYEYQEVPYMLNKDVYETGVSLEDFEDVMYRIEGEEKYLIATSEHPLLAQFKDEIIKKEDLPIKICSYSMCFRREVGSRGIDTKGLFRTHQFNKVEQVIISTPEDSWKVHEELQKNAEEIHQKLELPYRVVNICTGDLGNFAAKKYDIETWMPRQKKYGETCSNSNYTDYQARRANIKIEDKNDKYYAHTLNCTAVPTSRIMVAILENYQNKDGSITIPKVLRPYMFGIEKIEPNQ
ncbi:MAG: serine--tRNA ligase [Candidatus Woesearchaeota archaeon]